jgi:imidazolonepropionase-like amidohydrolase
MNSLRRIGLTLSVVLLFLIAISATRAEQPNLEFSGGRWWDGEKFVLKTFYSVNGTLTSVRPAHVDSVIDLTSKFVVPPFADAHVHNLNEDGSIAEDIGADLADGVFYAMEMDPAIGLSSKVLGSVNRPDSVDVIYTQGLVTPSWGVMPDMYSMLAQMGRFGQRKTVDQLDTHEIFIVNTKADLQKKWPLLAAQNRDFIKVIIAFSEQETMRIKDPARFGDKPPEFSAKPGVAPEVLKDLVERAHGAGLRVAAHIETAADFRLALDCGADLIAHLPASWQIGRKTGFTDGSLTHWELSDEDAKRASDNNVIIVTTLVKEPNDPDAAKYRKVYRHNLQLLAKRKAHLVIGTDMRGSVADEVLYISSLRVIGNRTLLNMLTRATPQAIFRDRKIGVLSDGYEASFLVLDSSPLDKLENIKHISFRFKEGNQLQAPPAASDTK